MKDRMGDRIGKRMGDKTRGKSFGNSEGLYNYGKMICGYMNYKLVLRVISSSKLGILPLLL